MMVVIRRKEGQELWIGGVHIVINDITGSTVAIGIDVPREVPIFRDSPTGKLPPTPTDCVPCGHPVDELLAEMT